MSRVSAEAFDTSIDIVRVEQGRVAGFRVSADTTVLKGRLRAVR